MEELRKLKEEKHKYSEEEWLSKRNRIIRSQGYYQLAQNKEHIDNLLSWKFPLKTKKEVSELNGLLNKLTFTIFGPWVPETFETRAADKAYFVKKNGLQMIIRLITNEYMVGEIREMAMSCLWNFCELDYQRRKAVKHGVIDAVLVGLTSKSLPLVRNSIGLLWGLAEYAELQELATSKGVIEQLKVILETYGNDSSFTSTYTQTNCLCIGCLYCISCNAKCRPAIRVVIPVLLMKFNNLSEVMDKYFICLTFANMLNDQAINLEDYKEKCIFSLKSFIETHKYETIRSIEEEQLYTWVNLKPFVDLTYSDYLEVYTMGMFSLANLTSNIMNRDLLYKDGLRDDVLAAAMYPQTNCTKSLAEKIASNFTHKVPSLSSMIHRKYYKVLNLQST